MLERQRNDLKLLQDLKTLRENKYSPFSVIVEDYRKLAQESVMLKGLGKGDLQMNVEMMMKGSTETLNNTIIESCQKIANMEKEKEKLIAQMKNQQNQSDEKVVFYQINFFVIFG